MRLPHPTTQLARSAVHIRFLHPLAVRTGPHLDEQDGLDAYTQDVLEVLALLAGLPTLSVPMAVGVERDGQPLGVSTVEQ